MADDFISIDELPSVVTKDIVELRGQGEALLLSANIVKIHEGTLRVHGTQRSPIVIEADGDCAVSAYGNVVVNARQKARVYAYNDSYVVAHDEAAVQVFDAGIVVANDASSAYLYGNARAYLHGSAKALAYENTRVVATDSGIVSARDRSIVELRGGAQAYAYDAAGIVAFDTSTVHINSASITADMRNSSQAVVEPVALVQRLRSLDESESYFNFEEGHNNYSIRRADNAQVSVEMSDPPAKEEPEDEDVPAIPMDRLGTDEQGTAPEEEADQQTSRHAATEESSSVNDLIARVRSAQDTAATSRREEEDADTFIPSLSPDFDADEPGIDLCLDSDDVADTVSLAPQLTDLETAPEPEPASSREPEPEHVPEASPETSTETASAAEEAETEERPGIIRVTAPVGDTAQDQLESQGWNIITAPTARIVDLQIGTDADFSTPSSSSSSSTSYDSSASGVDDDDDDIIGFDLGDEDDDDDSDFAIPGFN